jgi:hypothetical protein
MQMLADAAVAAHGGIDIQCGDLSASEDRGPLRSWARLKTSATQLVSGIEGGSLHNRANDRR